jgi:hypothetical protein
LTETWRQREGGREGGRWEEKRGEKRTRLFVRERECKCLHKCVYVQYALKHWHMPSSADSVAGWMQRPWH